MAPSLLIAAHGTRSAAGSATTRAVADAIAGVRPDTTVRLCFLDVESPSLADALADDAADETVVLPLLLSAGYHVRTDIPSVVESRPRVLVAEHLGPDPLVIDAVADRLGTVPAPATVLLAAVPSSQQEARDEVSVAAERLGERLGRDVGVLPLDRLDGLDELEPPYAIASYLLAEGGFLDQARAAVGKRGAVAGPIGVHPALVRLVWQRYDAVIAVGGFG